MLPPILEAFLTSFLLSFIVGWIIFLQWLIYEYHFIEQGLITSGFVFDSTRQ